MRTKKAVFQRQFPLSTFQDTFLAPQTHWSQWPFNSFPGVLKVPSHRLNGQNLFLFFFLIVVVQFLSVTNARDHCSDLFFAMNKANWKGVLPTFQALWHPSSNTEMGTLTSLSIFLHTVAAIIELCEGSRQLINIITECVEKQVI